MKQTAPPIPPNIYFLSCERTWEDSVWFHGTRSGQLAGIAEQGILPRALLQSQGNWAHNPSAEDMVYLTTAYALHYAKATDAAGLPAILELDLSRLDRGKFFADEDSYALSTVQDYPHLQALPVEQRVAFWRQNLHQTDPLESLRILGNATYKGAIPPDAVKQVRLLTEKEALVLTLQISDPTISPQNFKLMGGAAQRFCKWLVGQSSELDEWHARACVPSIPLMSLQEAVDYHRAHQAEFSGRKK